MKHLMVLVLVAGLVIACGEEKEVPQMKADAHAGMKMAKPAADEEKMIYYTCPMESHKHIHSAEPGTCSECNMTLVPGVLTSEDKMEYYGCPMLIHSHVRAEAPGRCDECKMELKPMRLKKATEI